MDYEELQSIGRRKVTLSLGLPMSLVNVIDRISAAENNSASHVFERLIRIGLQVERDRREAATKAT